MLVRCTNSSDRSKSPTTRTITGSYHSFRSFQSSHSYPGARRRSQHARTHRATASAIIIENNAAPNFKEFGSPHSLDNKTTKPLETIKTHNPITTMIKVAASYTWRRGGPDEKKPIRLGICNVLDWIRYPVVAMAR